MRVASGGMGCESTCAQEHLDSAASGIGPKSFLPQDRRLLNIEHGQTGGEIQLSSSRHEWQILSRVGVKVR
jgi:hypothetical protein